ncbi:Telomerase reverse transcriptase, partial [Coemansia sp. RSA 551]
MYAPKSHAEIASNTTRQHFGCSRIRLLPKERGFRAIVNMRRSFIFKRRFPVGPGNEFNKVQVISTNRQLADFQAALRPWCIAHPELFGSATFGPSDIYAKLKQFKESLSYVSTFGTERLYVAKLDIHHAFDTIPQERLLALLQTHLPDEEMMVHKYWTMTPSFSRFRSSFLRHGQAASDPTMFCELARGLSVRGKGLVFGDQSATAYFHTRKIYRRIAEHISQNIVKSHAQLLHQQRGIPQGSVLSSFLCNFFYGQLEQQYLAPLVSPQSTLMLRVIDDFLIVSTDRTQVVAVIERMSQGISEYGCRLNTAKTLVNFELKINGQP